MRIETFIFILKFINIHIISASVHTYVNIYVYK
jgi:hypothetical protein